MPWKIQKRGGKFCVIKESDGSTEKCHGSKAEALAHMRALYASEGKSMNDDAMIYFGGEVKALNDSGLVGGYLVRFTDAKRKDLSGEFFTAKTYLGPKDGDGAESLFDHGFPIPLPDDVDPMTKSQLAALADHTFAPLKTRRDAMGIWAEVVLDMSDEYEKRVYGMVQKKKLGWSSGSAGHRVRKNADGEITAWPIAEGSLTPCPCEPLNRAISMKSLASLKFVPIEDPEEEDEPDTEMRLAGAKSLPVRLTQFIDDSVEDGRSRDDTVKLLARECLLSTENVEAILTGAFHPKTAHLKAISRVLELPFDTLKAMADKSEPKTIKGMFEDELAGMQPSVWMLWNTYGSVVSKIAEAAESTAAAGAKYDAGAQLDEATAEYSARLRAAVGNQIDEYVSGESESDFYLKALGDPSEEDFVSAKNVDIEDHASLAVSAFKSIIARFKFNHEARVKAGRVLSDKNRKLLASLADQMESAVSACRSLLESTKPMASDMQKRTAQLNHLRVKEAIRQSLGGLQ